MHLTCSPSQLPARPAVAAVLLTASLLLGGCAEGRPGDQLWPNAAFVPEDAWTAPVAERQPQWWDDQIGVAAGTVDNQPATVVSNRSADRAITVHYVDGSGASQSIAIPAGGSVGVSSPPARVVAIE